MMLRNWFEDARDTIGPVHVQTNSCIPPIFVKKRRFSAEVNTTHQSSPTATASGFSDSVSDHSSANPICA